jgi:multiple sugar transport system permease protein
MWNTVFVSVTATFFSLFASVLAAYAIERLRFQRRQKHRPCYFLSLPWYRLRFCSFRLASVVFELGLFDTRLALILTYPTFLIPFCTWLLMGYFRTIPFELEECAMIDGANRWEILVKIILPLVSSGPHLRRHICIHACRGMNLSMRSPFISSSEFKTVPVGVVTELVEGDVYHWGAFMAGALFGSLPVAFIYSFFVEYYVSGMTGSVKE